MSDTLPPVTVIIAARPGQAEVKAAEAALQLDYPAEKLEILIARGRQPAVQRNAAVRAAKGELIYFLDDDSVPPPNSLRHAVPLFTKPGVQMVGGPNLCPPDAPVIEQAFALTMASWLAFGPSRARYYPVGKTRESGEKEMILCNLLARRSALLEAGGFNEALYPNEENALMDAIQAKGGLLLYDPELNVYRRPRSNIGAFARMLLNYGRGRAEQFRLHPTPGSVLNFVPPLFCFYLAACLFLPAWAMWPLAAYGVAVIAQTAALKPRRVSALLALPLLIFLTHVLYGLGFWRGLFTRLKSRKSAPKTEVTIETAKAMI